MNRPLTYRTITGIAFTFLLMASSFLDAQNCIDYPVIDGDPCGQCAPEGWEVVSDTPDILDPMNSFCNPEPSPTGGNVIHLWANGIDHFEAVSTEYVISDFIFGEEYYFSIYYSGCSSHPITISLTVDGESYDLQPDATWEYFELCFVPESETVEIELAVEFYDTGMASSSMIDTGVCDEFYCCPLNAEIEEESIELCPGEEQQVIVNVFDEDGTPEFEWSCDPDYGLDFLDDAFSGNPILSIPFDDEETQSFTYTVKIEDDECTIFRQFEFILNASDVPDFDVFLCEFYEEYELPLLSDEGYSGIWEGDFSWDELGGTVQEYTFIVNPGQDNCIEEWTYEYMIHTAEEVTFDFQSIYCLDDSETYRLPDESNERIEGDWDEDKFTPQDLGLGIHQFVFEVDKEYYCAEDVVFEIEVVSAQELTFDLPSLFCSSPDSIYLPDTSLQGVAGIWNPEFIDLNMAVQNQTIIFSTTDSTSCMGEYQWTYSVENERQAVFDIPDTLCRSLNILELDSFSLDGFKGYWTPEAVSFDTIDSDAFEIHWTPLDSNLCFIPLNLRIYVEDPQEPVFSLPGSLCADYGLYELPITSSNGLNGTWDTPMFNTDTISSNAIELTFTSDDQCALAYIGMVAINNDALDASDFNLSTLLCGNDEAFDLPLSSLSGVNGLWSQSNIDPSAIVDSLIVSFYPDNNANSCFDTLDITFYVSDLIEPNFNIPSVLCANSDQFVFPTTSQEGITGQWEIEEYSTGDLPGQTVLNNTFHPDDSSCYSELTVTIDLFDFANLDYTVSNSVSCGEPNGSIIITGTSDFELSIDDGASWLLTDSFQGLDGGNYTVLIRNSDNFCQDTIMFEIESPQEIGIIELNIDSIKDCSMQGATISCLATGSNLEYSLGAMGIWQDDNSFENIQEGQYWIYVRNANATDCIDSMMFGIAGIEQTTILDIIVDEVSGCAQMDGRIEILAEGLNLEYSINAGQDWQSTPIFVNLGFGIYNIVVRSTEAHDCLDESQVVFISPEVPTITMIDVTEHTSCLDNNGSIQIQAEGTNLEYSIDGGVSWSGSNRFEDLSGGTYTVMVRDMQNIDCFSSIEVDIDSPIELEILQVYLQQPSNCYDSDAVIEIDVNSMELQFSIDNGVTWQADGRFSNLDEGSYEMIILHPDYPGCDISYVFDIVYPSCPCGELNVIVTSEPVDCLDPISGSVTIESISGNIIEDNLLVVWDNGVEDMQLDNLTGGWVYYTIYYDKNCEQFDSVFIESYDPISFDLLSFDLDCEGLGIIEVTNFMGGTGEPSYSIDGIHFQENNVFTGLSAQEYQVFIEDLFNCNGQETVLINDNSDLQVEIPGVEPMEKGEIRTLNPLINEATIDSFEWSPVEGILNPGELIAEVSPEETTTYTLTIFFGDCIEIRSIRVEVIEDPRLYVANMFSPDDDGNNDYFLVQGPPDSEIKIESLNIFDRWGNLVFAANDFKVNSMEAAWDGRYNEKRVEAGVYVYQLRYTLKDKAIVNTGSITLIR